MVQDIGHLTITVIIEQRVDFGDYVWFGLANLRDRNRPLDQEGSCCAAAQTHVRGDFVGLEQRYIFDQQPQHTFPLANREFRIIPDPREISCDRQYLLPYLIIGSAALLSAFCRS